MVEKGVGVFVAVLLLLWIVTHTLGWPRDEEF